MWSQVLVFVFFFSSMSFPLFSFSLWSFLALGPVAPLVRLSPLRGAWPLAFARPVVTCPPLLRSLPTGANATTGTTTTNDHSEHHHHHHHCTSAGSQIYFEVLPFG